MKKKKKAGKDGALRRNRKGERSGADRGPLGILKRYLCVSAFCLVFSLIYNYYSHEISSIWMRRLCLWPLLLGGLPSLLQVRGILPAYPEGDDPAKSLQTGELMHDFCHFGIAALTSASLLKGILEIAGTDSAYPDLLLAVGALLFGAGAVYYIYAVVKQRKSK